MDMDRKLSPHAALVHGLSKGAIAIPVMLFTEYKHLGLTEGQVMLLIHIMAFQEKEGVSFPTVSQLECRMSVSGDEIVRWLQTLVQGGFIGIEESVDEKGLRSERYSTAPLLQQLAASSLGREGEKADKGMEKAYDNLFQLFERECGRPLSPVECETLTQWLDVDGHSEELIVAALREAVFVGKPNVRYIDRILLEWERNQVRSPEEAVEFSRRFRQQGILYQTKSEEMDEGVDSFSFYNWVNQSS
ncbi:DNA replication protein [Marininema mesophilum]|uniref:DNA replication protein n=1 Tax=Marininema mesophilum TaxID=1048340 RepID=A0A1H2ZFX3_9BACL|nr:DnaD domain protein [Marininema mesophilum]SDX16255.1 DNA replication protein [Marininema mesophilum]